MVSLLPDIFAKVRCSHLGQMNRDYFQSLDKEKLVEVAENLHAFAVEQLERLEQNSSNSSSPIIRQSLSAVSNQE